MNFGCEFIWRRFRRPYFVRPDGKKIMLVVENDVPCLVDEAGESYDAAPAPDVLEPVVDEEEVVVVEDEETKLSNKEEASSLWHLMTHEPKNEHCPTCQRSKMQAKPTPSRASRPVDEVKLPKKFR